MKRGSFAAGFLTCLLLAGVTTTAYAAGIVAERSTHRIVVDGKEAQMEAYVINGSNYVRLRDIGKAVGFEVYWDSENGCVQVESGKPYTGEEPAKDGAIKPTPQPEPTVPTNDADVDAMKQDIIDRTNALRKENGVAMLRVNDKLMQAAQVRADEMAAHTVYSHTRPNGGKFNTVTDCPYMAENIHRIADWVLSDQTLAERAVADWYASTVHHKNMVNPKLSEIGVGLARGVNDTGDPCWYCVQLFLYDGYSITRVDTPANK
ncbi:CAP domain-containing protein [Hominicoprocola fusiformis]